MTVSTLRPNGTVLNSGTLTGAATLDGALSDNSDSSYVTTFGPCQVSMGDLALPAGAIIRTVAIRLRTQAQSTTPVVAAYLLGVAFGNDVTVNWYTPTTTVFHLVSQAGWTDAQIDSGALHIDLQFSGGGLRIFEAYVDITHVGKPVVSADSPTGTLTDTNLPTIAWSNTLDSDGGAQTRYQVRLFTDAQYLAGGFDPATSPATIDTGEATGATVSWQATQTLPDDTYRAYVRVAQTVNGQLHWTDYDFAEFTIDVDLPGTPTLVASPDGARIQLAITDNPGVASTDRIEVQRSLDGGTTWEALRTLATGFVDVPFVVAVGELADAADGTTHNVPLPAPPGGILPNDLLLGVTGMDGNPTIAWPSDWTEIKDEAGNGSAVRAGVAWQRASGGETGTIAVTTSVSEGGGTRILCIRGAHTSSAPEVSVGVSSAAANANPDSLNPVGWGTEIALWIAAMVLDGNVAVTAGPAGYFNRGNTRWANVSGAGVATAERLSLAASEDPGAFTHVLEDSRAFTIAVRPRNPTLTVYDYEAPNGIAVTYRARTLHDYAGVFAASAWATDTDTWTSTSWWLKHPHRPDLNMIVRVRSYQTTQRAGRQGVFQALGATNAVVVSDTRGPLTGTITFRLDSIADQDALDELLDTRATLLVQAPVNARPPGYVRFSDQSRQKVVDREDATRVFDTLTFTAVAKPPGDVVAWP